MGNKRRTLVLGDIHGGYKALLQVLERSGFDNQLDRLIFLGDVADGWPETKECIEELLTIDDLVALRGNHDDWFLEFLETGKADSLWVNQGGKATIESYGGVIISPSGAFYSTLNFHLDNVPSSHLEYLRNTKLWHEEDGRMFVHGGWSWYRAPHPLQSGEDVMWDRELWFDAHSRAVNGRKSPLTQYREVYVGHTTTTPYGFTEPVQRCEVWNLDQGAGWEGKLSLQDLETKEFWQSDTVSDLYPEHRGRRG